MTYPRILIRNFSKGWNTTDLPAEMVDDEFYSSQSPNAANPTRIIERPDVADAQFPRLLNFFVTNLGRLKLRGWQKKITPSLAAAPQGMTRYFNATLSRLVYAAAGVVYAFNEALPSAAAQILGSVAPAATVDFVALYTALFWCDGVNARKWNGTSASDEPLGLAASTATGAAAVGAAGLLNSQVAGANQYVWYFTFAEADGTESNPTPGTPPLALTNQSASLSAIPVSANPMVVRRNVYRLGGTLTTVRFVGSLGDNVATTYTDNLADLAVGPSLLNFAHDPPPAGLSFMTAHKNRLFAAGDALHPYRIYFSSFGQPAYWPTVVYDPVNDGGYLDLSEPEFGNAIVGLAGTGSLLVIATTKSFYALYGDSQNDFVLRKICDTGCIARRTLIRCKNSVLFLGADKMVYSLEDTQPKPIALPLEATLQTVLPADMANASAVYQDQRYTLFIPQAGKAPVNMAYDFRVGCWTDLSDSLLSTGCCYGYPSSSLVGETLIGTAPGYLDDTGAAYNGILTAFTKGGTAGPLTVDFRSPDFELGRPSFAKRAKSIKIEGVFVGASPLLLTVTAWTPGRTPVQKTYPLVPSAAESSLLNIELSPKLLGRRLWFEIAGPAQALEINTIELAFQFIREAA